MCACVRARARVCGIVGLGTCMCGMCVHARAKNLSTRLRSSPPLLRTDLRHWQLLHDLFIFITWYIYVWIQRKLFARLSFRNCVLSIFRSDLYAIAQSIHPEAYWKLGEKLGYTRVKLEQWKESTIRVYWRRLSPCCVIVCIACLILNGWTRW